MTDKPKKIFLIYLAVLSLAGGIIIYLATSRQGPGVSTDAAMMLSTSENLLNGHGLTDYRGFELTQFPPVYSLLLALGSLLSRQDVFVVGWALSLVVFAATVWLSGLYFYAAFEEAHLLAWLGSFIVFSSTSLIEISSNIASDPLFLVLVLLFLFLLSAYLRSRDVRTLIAAAALTIIACFERYAGLALVITGGLILAVEGRRDWRKALARAGLFVACTAAPIFLWGYLHNAPVNGTVFGGRQPALPLENFVTGVEKVLYWFIPLRIISFVGPVLLLAIILLLGTVLLLVTRNMAAFQKLLTPQVLPSTVLLVVYGLVLVFDISTRELRGIQTDRVHIILLPSLLVVGGSLSIPLFEALRRKLGTRAMYGLTILLFAVWCIYPLSKTNEYVGRSMVAGDISSYNSMNRGTTRSTPLALYLQTLSLGQKHVYSNGSARAWFITHAQVVPLPQLQKGDRLNSLQQQYPHWPSTDGQVYIVWFKSDAYKEYYATPEELQTVADLRPLYDDPEGTVYLVSAR